MLPLNAFMKIFYNLPRPHTKHGEQVYRLLNCTHCLPIQKDTAKLEDYQE